LPLKGKPFSGFFFVQTESLFFPFFPTFYFSMLDLCLQSTLGVFMKTLLLGFLIAASGLAFGQNCEDQILDQYIKSLSHHEHHRILSVEEGLIRVSSENEGGYGIDAILFDPATCEILEIHNVYTE
jgi:hypothetical protein